MNPLVSVEWLKTACQTDDVRIVDASYFLPEHERDARAEYEAGHIPGAVFLDMARVADRESGLPMMLPSAPEFASHVGALGIGSDMPIIVYDNSPLRSAGRGWWMFRLFGARQVAVLDGGLDAWKAAGGTLESGAPYFAPKIFEPRADLSSVRSMADVADAILNGSTQIADARSAARFSGAEPESRPGLRAGHMPGARNLPNAQLFTADGRYKSPAELKALFEATGIDPAQPLVTTCGSGVTAANILLAATLIGARDVGLYDGSWSEWGAQPDNPVVTGN